MPVTGAPGRCALLPVGSNMESAAATTKVAPFVVLPVPICTVLVTGFTVRILAEVPFTVKFCPDEPSTVKNLVEVVPATLAVCGKIFPTFNVP